MFGGSLTKFNKSISSGGAADNTPDAVNWTNVACVAWDDGLQESTYTKQRITGITTSITIKINRTTAAGVLLYRKVTTTNDTYSGNPTSNSFTLTSDGATFSVNNNDYVHFAAGGSGPDPSATVTVKNNSSGDTTLDTFSISWSPGI